MTKSTTTQTAPDGQNSALRAILEEIQRDAMRLAYRQPIDPESIGRAIVDSTKDALSLIAEVPEKTRLQFSPVRHEQAPVGWDRIEGGAL